MNVLLVSQYYPPEIGATQNRMSEFVKGLVARGHQVDVLTEIPNHPAGIVHEGYRDRWFYLEGAPPARIARVWVATSPRKSFVTRLAFYGSFAAMALAAGVRLRSRYDAVVATSPPLPAAMAGLLLSRWKEGPFVLDVRDLWPGAAKALGELSNPVAYRAAERMELALYRGAVRVVVTTEGFKKHIETVTGRPVRVDVVPNGTRADLFVPGPRNVVLRAQLGIHADFVAAYIGLHGIAQDLETILAAAHLLRNDDVAFLFVGEGPEKQKLMEMARDRRLRNVYFVPAVPPEDCARFLTAADVALVPLAPNQVFATFVPSKMFDAMACERPVLLGVPGEARALLERAGAGWFVDPGDPNALAAAVRVAAADPAGRKAMGARGREFVVTHYSRAAQAERFATIVEEAAAARGKA